MTRMTDAGVGTAIEHDRPSTLRHPRVVLSGYAQGSSESRHSERPEHDIDTGGPTP
jgi:hypothetical protein